MKSFIKFPLCALLLFAAAETALPSAALAGQRAVETVTDSSSTVNFAPAPAAAPTGGSGGSAPAATEAIAASPEVSAAVSTAVSSTASNVAEGEAIPLLGDAAEGGSSSPSLSGESPASAESREAVEAVFSGAKDDSSSAIFVLGQQIVKEAGGLDAEASDKIVSMLETASAITVSPENLPAAIVSFNALIEDLSRDELIALGNSPSFMAVRYILTGGNEAL